MNIFFQKDIILKKVCYYVNVSFKKKSCYANVSFKISYSVFKTRYYGKRN